MADTLPVTPLSPATITAAIQDQIAEWLASGRVKTVREIGQGQCYDFAEAIWARLGYAEAHIYETGPLTSLHTEDWWARIDEHEAECFSADIPRLRAEGAPVPDDIPDDVLAGLIGAATHEWIFFEGLHFDATAPEGVAHWLDLPFFANQIAGCRAERQAIDRHPVLTEAA